MQEMSIKDGELICLDLINTLVLRDNDKLAMVICSEINKISGTCFEYPKIAMRMREKYIEYSLGNYTNDYEYVMSILLHFIQPSFAKEISPIIQPQLLDYIYPITSCKEFLAVCASKCKLVLASNFVDSWVQFLLKKFDLEKYFERMYISSNFHYRKPSIEFYSKIFNDYPQIAKNKIWMIGDSIVNDFYGAKETGINSILFNNETDNTYYSGLGMTYEQILKMF